MLSAVPSSFAMLHVISIASNALEVQTRKLDAIASAVALSTGAPRRPDEPERPTPVRIGALPVEGPIEAMVSLKEVELAYRMNAAVIETADDMLGSLLETVDREQR